jgi:hypothetical protein
MSFNTGVTEAIDSDSLETYCFTAITGMVPFASRTIRKVVPNENSTITAKYKSSSGTAYFLKRTLKITPVRVA